ncbi:hypothetical protein [Actinoplanes sp. DH11]|uniref:hypothetical protein n=1 Tax=Actinoplanes sp. DH11 TaxID=2857011 RepID=UPI001E59192F|nr:hypothetical protein [Actinoplanes sp. DH11]
MTDPAGHDDGAVIDKTVAVLAGAGMNALLTLLLGPGGTAMATLISAATQPTFEELAYFARAASARRAARAQRAIDVTAASAGWTPDRVVQTALSDDRLLEMTTRALTAAAEAATEAKIEALGRALAAGLLADDPARVDTQVLVLAALAELESADLRLLLLMDQPTDYGSPRRWTRHQLADADDGLTLAVDALLARCARLGVISDAFAENVMWGHPTWWITDFGKHCLTELNAHGTADTVPAAPVPRETL